MRSLVAEHPAAHGGRSARRRRGRVPSGHIPRSAARWGARCAAPARRAPSARSVSVSMRWEMPTTARFRALKRMGPLPSTMMTSTVHLSPEARQHFADGLAFHRLETVGAALQALAFHLRLKLAGHCAVHLALPWPTGTRYQKCACLHSCASHLCRRGYFQ